MATVTGVEVVISNLNGWYERLLQQMRALLDKWAATILLELKLNAPWLDQTGEARARLSTEVDYSTPIYALYLIGGVDYNIFLELKPPTHGGRPILAITAQTRAPQIKAEVEALF